MRLDKHASSRRRQQAATHRPADLKLSRFKMSTELLCFFDSVSVCACAHRRRSSRNQWYAHSPRCHRLGWLTILRHRIKGCLPFTRARAPPGAVAPHGADILSDARGSPGTGALNGTGAPGADARCPTRRRRHAHALSGPAARKHACSHIHTHSRGCAVSFQADLQARPVGRGPGSVPSGNRDRQGLC